LDRQNHHQVAVVLSLQWLAFELSLQWLAFELSLQWLAFELNFLGKLSLVDNHILSCYRSIRAQQDMA
jgi:hypothetical protein